MSDVVATEPGASASTARRTDPPVRVLGIALAVSLALWQLPYGAFLLYPFKLLSTWIHELSHGVMMVLTGIGFDRMEVYRDGSGISIADTAPTALQQAFIAPAGYMGTPLLGAALLVIGQRVRGARWALGAVGALVVVCAIALVANSFGQAALAVLGAVLLALSALLPARWAIAGANLLAAQMCINAVLDIRVLFRPLMVVDGVVAGNSDAHNMALATFGTTDQWAAYTWSVAWLVWSLGLLYVAIRIVQRRR